jgi:hypothetical protein
MKGKSLALGILFIAVLYSVLTLQTEGYKNVDFVAKNQIERITNKVLPSNALCIRGAQCQSGVCINTNNETTYGYCK